MQRLRKSGILLRNLWLRLVDPKRLSELAGDRVVFKHLKDQGFLDPFRNKRILEIGPKHGQDSMLLTTLDPSELTLIDLPEKEIAMKEWFSQVSWKSRPTLFSGNVLYLTQEQYKRLGMFDLIWCLGVLYHNAEQLRLLRRLFDLLNIGGCVVIESATTRNKKLEKLNVVEIHWPSAYRNVPTITHLPSRLAIKS